jgi:signal recognition particle subunit SRP54
MCLTSVNPGQQFTKIVYDEMVKMLGEERSDIAVANTPPTVILIAGLQGSGKTTFAGKLARYLKTGEQPQSNFSRCRCLSSGRDQPA